MLQRVKVGIAPAMIWTAHQNTPSTWQSVKVGAPPPTLMPLYAPVMVHGLSPGKKTVPVSLVMVQLENVGEDSFILTEPLKTFFMMQF
jgi:hypothetical protein